MGLQVVVQPYAEVIHLQEMKNQIKVDSSMTDDDALIVSNIIGATDAVETATGANLVPHRQKTILATTFSLTFDFFPIFNYRLGFSSFIQLPRVPVVSPASVTITYVDNNGATQTVASSVYTVDISTGRIYLAFNQYWPITRFQPNAITVQWVAGMAASFTANASTSVITVAGRTFAIGDQVRLINSGGSLPAGLLPNTDYFILAGGQLSLTSGGTAVTITGVGVGTHFLSIDIKGLHTLRNAVLFVANFWYDSRSAVETGRAAIGATVLPWQLEALVASQHA